MLQRLVKYPHNYDLFFVIPRIFIAHVTELLPHIDGEDDQDQSHEELNCD